MKSRAILFLACLIILSSCSEEKNIKVYVLDGGTIEAKDGRVLGLDSGSLMLANNIFLIKHPKGILLWDTGLPEDLVDSINGSQNALAIERVSKRLTTQLNEIGISPNEVMYLALSHMHNDHTGNANLFSNSVLLIQTKEFDHAFSDSASKYYYNPDSYNKLKKFVKITTASYDVFGDGRVVIWQTPGHTAGHQSLMLNLKKEGNIFITGDLFHHVQNRALGKFPIFNYDQSQTMKSVADIERLIEKSKARVIIQHDPSIDKQLKKSPAYYE
ncbi:MAG: N-acyl homoserine lactonase family protein [Bacteroidetes bacterium]|nr:N-acyl homoserine lactonase family protein [Bacteroidota bacterium]